MSAPTRIKMPPRHDGSQVPNPWRYICDHGHIHPSFMHAVKCNKRHRAQS